MIGPVVKTASCEPERSQLRHEAQLLLRARHPGVVTIRSFTDQDGTTCLTIAPVDGWTLADAPPKEPIDALRYTAALARTVADLHELGIAHRALRADHVLSTADGRPMLCELGDATSHAADDDRRTDADALRGLVELIALAVTPESRGSRAANALRTLATDLRDDTEPASPAEIAVRAKRAVARHESRFRRSGARPSPGPRRPRRHRLAAFALGPVIVVGSIVLMSRHAGEPSAREPNPTTSVTVTTIVAPESPAPTVVDTTPRRVEAGGALFDVGQTGDDVVVADWHCDGEPSAALLRPTTGEVFVFSSLPAAGETLTARLVATVPGAVSIVADRTDAPCPPLVVRRTDGSNQPVGDR